MSIGIDDMIIPTEKSREIDHALKQISDVEKQHKKGVITNQERYNKVIDIWTHCNRPDRERDAQDSGIEPEQEGVQPGVPDGGFGAPRQ